MYVSIIEKLYACMCTYVIIDTYLPPRDMSVKSKARPRAKECANNKVWSLYCPQIRIRYIRIIIIVYTVSDSVFCFVFCSLRVLPHLWPFTSVSVLRPRLQRTTPDCMAAVTSSTLTSRLCCPLGQQLLPPLTRRLYWQPLLSLTCRRHWAWEWRRNKLWRVL